MKQKMILVVGPTAVGKTALGIKLAQAFNGEIISGDSQQVYRQLDIGTAKASPEERGVIPHHLIDVRDVDDTYSAYDFVKEAKKAIAHIASKGKIPIVVGGTGLYLQSLIEGYHLGGDLDQEELLVYRAALEKKTDDELFDMVAKQHLIVKEINRRRAIRALELATFGQDLTNRKEDYDVLLIGLTDERQRLYERINNRVDSMMAAGLLAEAKWLYDNHPSAQSSRGIGYKEFFPYFEGNEDLEQAVARLKQNTRRFAKRQLTWFKNRMSVPFYHLSDESMETNITTKVERFLKEHHE